MPVKCNYYPWMLTKYFDIIYFIGGEMFGKGNYGNIEINAG